MYGDRNRLENIYRKKKGETGEELYVEYEYDDCGNTTKRTIYKDGGTEEIVFEYDTMNRLVKTTEGADVTEYYYDNAGNRFIKEGPDGTTVYLRHGQIAVAMDIELPVSTTEELGRVSRYVLSGDLLAGRITEITKPDLSTETKVSYYHLDHLNSTKCVTDESGVVEVMYEYRAFGEQLKRLDGNGDETEDSAKYSYGGKELDDGTNLYYFNARYYDATIGRFINVDPVQDGSNWYVYCGNNPLCAVDPTGLEDGNITNLSNKMSLQVGPYLIQETNRKPELSNWEVVYSEYMIAKNAAYIAKKIALNDNLKAAILSTSSSAVALAGDWAEVVPYPGNDTVASAIDMVANNLAIASGGKWTNSALNAILVDEMEERAEALLGNAYKIVSNYYTEIKNVIADYELSDQINKYELCDLKKFSNCLENILDNKIIFAEKIFQLAAFAENQEYFQVMKPIYPKNLEE